MADRQQIMAALRAADAAGDAEAAQRLAKMLAPPASLADNLLGSLSALGQGASLGFVDEAAAALGAIPASIQQGVPIGEAYRGIRDAARARDDQFADRAPGTSLAFNLLGGLATGGAGVARTSATSLGGMAARGAGIGGVAGLGAGRGDFGDQALSTVTGAVAGGALAPVIPAAGAALSRLRDPAARANARFQTLMRRDGIDEQGVANRLRELGPQATIADVAPNLRASAESMAQMPGRAQTIANDLVESRQMGQAARITSSLDDALGNGQSLMEAEQTVAQALRSQAAPLYQQADEVPIVLNATLRDMLNRPAGRRALAEAQRLAANEGQELSIDVTSGVVPTRVLDLTKRALDDIVEANTNVRGAVNNEGRIVANMARTLRNEMDQQNPIYGRARSIWESDKAVQNALEAGQKFMREDSERIAANFGAMSKAEQEMFRVGALQTLRNRVLSKSDTADSVKGLFNSPMMRERIRAIMPDDEAFARLQQSMEAESQFFRTNTQLLGNSATARRLFGAQEAEGAQRGVESLLDILSGQGAGAAAVSAARRVLPGAARNLGRPVEQRSEPVRDVLGRLLMDQRPEVQQMLLQGLPVTPRLPARGGAVAAPAGLLAPGLLGQM